MKSTLILFCLIIFNLSVKGQNKVTIDDISLVQLNSKNLELRIPKNGLDTGDVNKKKRISVYKNQIVKIKNSKGISRIISKPEYSIEGFCNKNTFQMDHLIEINCSEYVLEVTYIYPDKSERIQTKSMIIK